MTTIIQMLLQSFPILISMLIPGLFLSFALFRKNLNRFELVIMGLLLGMVVPSLFGFIEGLAGILFTFQLHLVNILLTMMLAIIFLWYDAKHGSIQTPFTGFTFNKNRLLLFGSFALILLFAWWIRLQAMSPNFYEFDPYWYNKVTQYLITDGQVAIGNDDVWYPLQNTYRGPGAIVSYIEAGWYHIFAAFNGIQGYDFQTGTLVSSLYPPLAAMLTGFFLYLFMSRRYGIALAILSAGLLLFSPSFIDKTLAGEFEIQPFGLMTILFFIAMMDMALKEQSNRITVMAAFALMLTLLASSAGKIPLYAFVGISAFVLTMKTFKDELTSEDIIHPNIIASGAILAFILSSVYAPFDYLVDWSQLAVVLGFMGYSLVLWFFLKNVKKEDKLLSLLSLIVGGVFILAITPASHYFSDFSSLLTGVTTYTDPTFKTIAEQTSTSGAQLHNSLGVLGIDYGSNPSFSLAQIIFVLSVLIGLYVLIKDFNMTSLIGIVFSIPLSLTGMVRAKFIPYTAIFVPIMFCMSIGEIYRRKENYRKFILLFVGILLSIQLFAYYDVILGSFRYSTAIDITDNSIVFGFCNNNTQSMQAISQTMGQSFFTEMILNAKQRTQMTYCNRISDDWLDAMSWINSNVESEDRIMSWWDYGHWTISFGQKKTVTGNTHRWTIMHQEVADKIVGNSSDELIAYMRDHKAKYLLLDYDLVGKWGALTYHYCVYNNQSTLEDTPGQSDCDRNNMQEVLYAPTSVGTTDICSLKIENQTTMKVYSTFSKSYGFDYYCIQNKGQSFYYEDGTKSEIEYVGYRGRSGAFDTYFAFYGSSNIGRKGSYYDSIFFKGFFERRIDGMELVYPKTLSNSGIDRVLIYKISDSPP